MNELERARELLAWHSQDALTGDDLVFMRQWLEQSGADEPAIAQELAWLRSTAAQLRAQVEEEARMPQQPVDAGLRALMERIALDRPLGIKPPGWNERIGQWLRDVLGVRSTGWAMAVMAVVAVQAGVIALLLADPPATQAPLSGAAHGVGVPLDPVLLTVAFRPETTEAAMRSTLAGAGAQIVSGPSALGLYLVAVPRDQADRLARQLLAATAVVESVQR